MAGATRTLGDVDDETIRGRIAENPRPAVTWAVGALALFVLEFGAFAHFFAQLLRAIAVALPGDPAVEGLDAAVASVGDLPTLLSRETIPNRGYWNGQRWEGTFFGLAPASAWGVRLVLIYAYAFAWLGWLWVGYDRFRAHYRAADWTPRDDQIDRLRHHAWGLFGFLSVFLFVVMAVFAPAISPTSFDANLMEPYSHTISYWDANANAVSEITVGQANFQSSSQGSPDSNVGPFSYDQFNRYHPFGTLTNGKDLFTFIAHGSRITLFVGMLAITLASFVAATMALATAYFKGLLDIVTIVASDTFQSLPSLMLLIAMAVVFDDTWIAGVYNGAFLIAVIFAVLYWPALWRSIRGPSLQVAEEEWIDAARSFGQRPRVIMRKHMAPYVLGYLLVYASMSLAGVIIGTAGLSFLALGITAPTPEWGRAISMGQPYVASASWHISLIPGILITIIATGFNAMGDGIRDAIDPESEGGEGGGQAAAAGGSGA
jgi:peptide/nickel transport system permease protein